MDAEKRWGETRRSTQTISELNKGLGPMDLPASAEWIAAQGWNLLEDDVSLPAAVIYKEKLDHNLQWMQRFVDAYGARLAPHGKTTMAPKLFSMQLHAGAWGITMATAHQARVAYAYGVRRVLMANQLVGRQNMEIIASLLCDPSFDYFCLVDSVENLAELGHFFQSKGQRLQVLLEVGLQGGRTGVRNMEQLEALLTALAHWHDTIVLCGVEVYEGISKDETEVRGLLQRAVEFAKTVVAQGALGRHSMILSGGGTAWFDLVAEAFSRSEIKYPTEVVLRPGCYLTHDVGDYKMALERATRINPVAREMESTLLPAMQVWAYVHSVPEPTKAIVGMGKRDAAFDCGLPTPALHVSRGGNTPQATPGHWRLTRIMDQHAYLEITSADSIQVGDKIAFDISHPCLTFDRWRHLLIINAHHVVVDIVETLF